MRTERRVAGSVLRAGWLIPLWLSVRCVKAWCELDLLPRIDHHGPLTSFPLLEPALFLFSAAMV
jgi:hypothetical protein